jgi:hypothetical protein
MAKIIKGPWDQEPIKDERKDGVRSFDQTFDGRSSEEFFTDVRENFAKGAKIEYFMDEDVGQYYCIVYSGLGGYTSFEVYKIYKDGRFVKTYLPNSVFPTTKELFLQNVEEYTNKSKEEIESQIYGFRLRIMSAHGDSKKRKNEN